MTEFISIIVNGMATTVLIGAGVDMAVVFSTLITGIGSLVILLVYGSIILYSIGSSSSKNSKMPGVRCPTCLARGIEQWVTPGKHCPRCSTAC